jgi:hypothetical protein
MNTGPAVPWSVPLLAGTEAEHAFGLELRLVKLPELTQAARGLADEGAFVKAAYPG